MGFKTTVEIDGKQHEVEIDGVIPEAKVNELYMPKDAFQAEMKRRVDSAIEGEREKLLEGRFTLDDLEGNEELRGQVITKLDLKPGAGGKSEEEFAAAIRKAREEATRDLTVREIDPRKKELEKAGHRITALTQKALRAEIVRAAAALGVKPSLLKPPTPDAQPPIVAMLENAFGYDGEAETWFVREGDSFKVAPNATKDRLYMNVEEFLTSWTEDKGNAEFIDAQRQPGPGLGGDKTPGTQSGRDVYLSPEEAADHTKFQEAKERATKQGGVVKTTGYDKIPGVTI